ncbi:putative LOC102098435, transcript variant X2 [Columba livia]|uniref:Putative LOC102098435, transcript variant X2 n=1 Tax=Columba livia TaxID=8932 RepID=A0A2I0LPN4_COLLI|nr:uncharacterized protein LOC102098435 isoform X2 [Columba livia]PKK19391.1 putative LOC102098435, transcript variant X2 [Columba livia]
MEVQLAGGLLPLLLLAWLPAGLTHQTSATIDVLVGLDVILQCLLPTSTTGEVKWFNITQNNGGKQNESEMEEHSAQLLFHNLNKAHTGTYACRTKSTGTTFRNRHSGQNPGKTNKPTSPQRSREEGPRKKKQRLKRGTTLLRWEATAAQKFRNNSEVPQGKVRQPEESDIPMDCWFKIWTENLIVHVKWYKSAGLEMGSQTDTVALGENCTELTSSDESVASVGLCVCRVFVTRINSTDTGNGTQEAVPTCVPGALQTNVTEKETWTALCAGLYYPLCIIFGLAVGTLLYMPIICFLLWQRRRNRKGKLTSRQVAEENQLSTAAPVTGTEDLTYANLKFEKKGTKPTSSDIIYTEIKPLQQQQKSRDAGAADAGVDVSPEGGGK